MSLYTFPWLSNGEGEESFRKASDIAAYTENCQCEHETIVRTFEYHLFSMLEGILEQRLTPVFPYMFYFLGRIKHCQKVNSKSGSMLISIVRIAIMYASESADLS